MLTGADLIHRTLAPWYRGRRVVLVGRPLGQVGPLVEALLAMGAEAPFLLANEPGRPPRGLAGFHVVRADMASRRTYTRDLVRLVADPPNAVRAALAGYDPEGSALVLTPTGAVPPTMDGRAVAGSGHRRHGMLGTLDELDALWDAVGSRRLPYDTVDCSHAALAEAAARRDLGYGTLWQGIARDPEGPPAAHTHLVRSGQDAVRAASRFSATCERARVSPVVPGLAVGITGFVLPGGAAVLPPYEDIVLERNGEVSSLGCSTFFEPSPEARSGMVAMARAIGERLDGKLGYRGPYRMSGLLVGDAFVPVDLALGGGLVHAFFESKVPGLCLELLNAALISGFSPELTPTELEAVLAAAVERDRGSVLVVETPAAPPSGTRSRWLTRKDGLLQVAEPRSRSVGSLVHTPSGGAGKLLLIAGPSFPGRGGIIGADAALACRIAEREWNLGIGETSAPWPGPR
ncbi:hypothetical protein [Kitasatospora sp. NPDC059571]|uniref:hypothetical protein n=1 Tax=Kitasatospora sp. NPDC059571 TaxID=3346871 RepID=UPI0036A9474F